MSYLVLARKYRPRQFADIIGQDHITDLLEKSIQGERVAHAYLFCGPRGVGKTSCARIFAQCLNCEDGPRIDPDLNSVICQEIAKGTSFDVLEIDGASNRGIDEIRALRENVKFAPTVGRYKIYIVDEVHMLTTEAFNALLKTLEEPPEHVKFIFATTAPNKLPSTIISRCQRFDFKRIPIAKIMEVLSSICQKEEFKVEDKALFAIAKAAQGSLRDSLSILDQLSALSERKIQTNDVYSMLGLVETEFLFDLVDALGDKDCQSALDNLDKIIGSGKDIKQLSKDITEHFRHLMIIKVGGKSLGKLVDYPIAVKELILKQTEKFTLEEILKALETFIESQEVSRITESLRMPLEVAFAKITYPPGVAGHASRPRQTAEPVLVKSKGAAKPSTVKILNNQKGQADFSMKKASESAGDNHDPITNHEPQENLATASAPMDEVVGVLDLQQVKRSWNAITYAISKERMSVATFLQEGSPYDFDGQKLTIGFPEASSFHKEALEDKDNMNLIERNFSDKLRKTIRIELKVIDHFKPQEDEQVVQDALEMFNGKVINKWHNES